jgi:hypothetical protein
MHYSCYEDVDIEEFQDAITDSFSPVFDIPITPITLRRIMDIRPRDTVLSQSRTLFIYNGNYDNLWWTSIRYIWNTGDCDKSLTYIYWEGESIKEAYVGKFEGDVETMSEEELELFKQDADKWVYEIDEFGTLQKVFLAGNPGIYRRFTYNYDRDFFDSIIDYRQDSIHRTLKYQYAADNWMLTGILDLDKTGDTTGIYSFEFESIDWHNRHYNPLYMNKLIGIPNVKCNYLYLNGPLLAWHFPDPVKKLFKNGILVYEAVYEYESIAAYPEVVNYSRIDSMGTASSYSEKIITEETQW